MTYQLKMNLHITTVRLYDLHSFILLNASLAPIQQSLQSSCPIGKYMR